MADDGANLLHDFEQWAGGLLARMEPAARRKLTQAIARELRRRQQARIAAQKNPDGSPWAPRQRLRRKAGGVKRRKMYQKLRLAKHLKLIATPDEAGVQYTGRDAWIARVAQYGLVDRVSPRGPRVRYPARQLLGFSRDDREWLRDFLVHNLLPGD